MLRRDIWIGSGWKMTKTIAEAEAYASALREFLLKHPTFLQIFVVPSFTSLRIVYERLKNTSALVGAQNMHWETGGAFTGEISPAMIRDCGARLIEIGHAERRQYFGETDLTVNRKVRSALAHQLRPLICVGETAQEKEAGNAEQFVSFQVKTALHGVAADQVKNILFAYEPVWAIGTQGIAAEPHYTNQIHALIRQTTAELYGDTTAESVAILYGGSVSPDNAVSLIEQPQIDGLFIGRSSWQVNDFIAIIQIVETSLNATHALK